MKTTIEPSRQACDVAPKGLWSHHLRPERTSAGAQQQVCAYCGKTEKQIREAS